MLTTFVHGPVGCSPSSGPGPISFMETAEKAQSPHWHRCPDAAVDSNFFLCLPIVVLYTNEHCIYRNFHSFHVKPFLVDRISISDTHSGYIYICLALLISTMPFYFFMLHYILARNTGKATCQPGRECRRGRAGPAGPRWLQLVQCCVHLTEPPGLWSTVCSVMGREVEQISVLFLFQTHLISTQ